jgi:surface polysaccharide O-acyltransferase-like enzyme
MNRNSYATSATPQRLVYMDHARSLAAVLVVLIHVAIIYGNLGGESGLTAPGEPVLLLLWFCLVAQPLAMSLLFFVSGYFVPTSFDRKGPLAFLRERLVRLGLPLLLYDLLVTPLLAYSREVLVQNQSFSFGWFAAQYTSYLSGIGTGPMWFVWNLLLFDVGYACWRWATAARPQRALGWKASAVQLAVLLLAVGVATFIMRLVFPYGWFNALNLRLPSWPQYLGCFVLGLLAARGDWLQQLLDNAGRFWLITGTVAALAFPLLNLAGVMGAFAGGFSWQALLFALWETTAALALGLGLLALFRQRYNRMGTLGQQLAANAFAVYVLHVPIIFLVGLFFRGVALPPLLLFAIVSLITVPLCFFVCGLLRKLPGVARVL